MCIDEGLFLTRGRNAWNEKEDIAGSAASILISFWITVCCESDSIIGAVMKEALRSFTFHHLHLLKLKLPNVEILHYKSKLCIHVTWLNPIPRIIITDVRVCKPQVY